MPDNSLIDRYRESLRFVLRHKWLYLIPFLPTLINQIYSTVSTYYFAVNHPELGQPFPQKIPYISYSFSERLSTILRETDWMTAARHALVALPVITIFALWGGLGLLVMALIFIKRLRSIFRKYPPLKTYSRYFLFLALGAASFGVVSMLLSNIWLASLGMGIAVLGIQLFISLVAAIIEGVFLVYVKSLFQNEAFSLDAASDFMGQNWQPLFWLNVIFIVASTSFYVSLALLPQFLLQLIPREAPQYFAAFPYGGIFPNNFWVVTYCTQAIATVVLLFTPFLSIVKPGQKLISLICEGLILIKKNFGFYIGLLISGALVLLMFSILYQLLITAPIFSYAYDGMIGVLYAFAQTFFLVVFSVLVFRWIIFKFQPLNNQ